MADTDPRVQPLAELRLRRYDSEYRADHLTWLDFADDVREDLALLDSLPPTPEEIADAADQVAADSLRVTLKPEKAE